MLPLGMDSMKSHVLIETSTLVVFHHNLYKKYIPIRSYATAIDLPNGIIIYHMNEDPLLYVDD